MTDQITAKVVCDSISPDGVRLTTLQLQYPRMIHSEFMTHRVFSRNASSSRAIPTSKLSLLGAHNMVYPHRWGKNKPGMQPSEESLSGPELEEAIALWEDMAQVCLAGARRLAELGVHKQWANRPLEWFGTISVVVTATEWSNFFALRDHPAAQDEIRILAQGIKNAMGGSMPKLVPFGKWHLPYIRPEEVGLPLTDVLAMSAARCARVSYLNHDGVSPSLAEDISLFHRLVGSVPQHMSPVEHQAVPLAGWHGNFHGWKQHRQYIENDEYSMITEESKLCK